VSVGFESKPAPALLGGRGLASCGEYDTFLRLWRDAFPCENFAACLSQFFHEKLIELIAGEAEGRLGEGFSSQEGIAAGEDYIGGFNRP
jgi:hypothetical protein